MQATTVPISGAQEPVGTRGFLDPDMIVEQFGAKDGMKVADFGSGGGYFTLSLAQKVGSLGRVYALDIIEDKLDNIRAKARVLGLDNLETIRTNLEVLGSSSLTDESQDIVLMANILFQSNKRSNIMEEGIRILKKGGEMIVIDWQKNAGGFGPPNDIRPDEAEIQAIAKKIGLSFVRKLDTGQFHFGLIFKK